MPTQVLLISGGESLEDNTNVCNYSAGTDTNPIFLFSADLTRDPPQDFSSLDGAVEKELLQRAEASGHWQDSPDAVTQRANLAHDFSRITQDQVGGSLLFYTN